MKPFLQGEDFRKKVEALDVSHLDGGNSQLNGISETTLTPLKCIFHAAAQLIMGLKKFGHITLVLKDLHWLLLQAQIIFKIRCITYKAFYTKIPVYIANKLTISGRQ